MIFKANDLVEQTFEKTLGLVEKNHDTDRIWVTTRGGQKELWHKSQCIVVAREGNWVKVVEMRESANWLDNFRSVAKQLLEAGMDIEAIAEICHDFGKLAEPADKNDQLRKLLEQCDVEVRWV